MPISVPSPTRRPGAALYAVALAGLLAGALATSPAARAATAEQEEACTPDAVKFCSNTIPDIPKTTACMEAHKAQLSPRCRAAFNDATGGHKTRAARAETTPDTRRDRVSRSEVAPRPGLAPRIDRGDRDGDDDAPAIRPRDDEPDVGALPDAPRIGRVPGLTSYRRHIAHLCDEGLIDPFTCRNTMKVLSQSE